MRLQQSELAKQAKFNATSAMSSAEVFMQEKEQFLRSKVEMLLIEKLLKEHTIQELAFIDKTKMETEYFDESFLYREQKYGPILTSSGTPSI